MSQAPQAHDPLIGRIIDGRYEIQQRIGEGGMGVVYKARQVSIDRTIAIKMLNQQMAQDPNWVERFYNEARACSRLQHPNTIRMFDFGQTREGKLFMTMEFLDGVSLRHAIAAGAPMAPPRVLKILIQCCASLAEAHSLKIIHRDIKPDNVFLLNLAGSPDFVKLLDFSVAKLLQAGRLKTQAGVVFGTPQYMSPEQGRGVPLDVRSDLYSLGCLAFEMLTGRVPYDDRNAMTVLQMHLMEPIPSLPPQVPQAMTQIVIRAMAKEADQRFQSAQDMMQSCQQAFAQLGAQAAGMSGAVQPRPPQLPSGHHHGPPPAVQAPSGQRAAAKTIMADAVGAASVAPLHNAGGPGPGMGGPPPGMGGPPPPMGAPQGPTHASAKTIMADGLDSFQDPSSPGFGGSPQGSQPSFRDPSQPGFHDPSRPGFNMAPGVPPGGAPMGQGGAKKTVMLSDSEGVVSFTSDGSQPMTRPGGFGPPEPSYGPSDDGPGFVFWAISLTSGIVLGVLAYLILIKIQG